MKLIGYKIIYKARKKAHKRILFQNADTNEFFGFSEDDFGELDFKKLIIGREYNLIYSVFDKKKIIDIEEVLK